MLEKERGHGLRIQIAATTIATMRTPLASSGSACWATVGKGPTKKWSNTMNTALMPSRAIAKAGVFLDRRSAPASVPHAKKRGYRHASAFEARDSQPGKAPLRHRD